VSSPESKDGSAAGRHRNPVRTSETTGLVLIVVLILAITLVRYWHAIHWSWR
jgi:hypothetical protein